MLNHSPSEIYVAAREVMRSNSEVPAQKIEQVISFQRQRSCGNDWLEWAIMALAPVEKMREIDRKALDALWEKPHELEKSSMLKNICMIAVDKWWGMVNDELKAQGDVVAGNL